MFDKITGQNWCENTSNPKAIEYIGLGGWLVKKFDDGALMIFDMAGVSKENVKISVKKNKTLIIKAVADKELPDDDDASVRSFHVEIEFFEKKAFIKHREIKAKMKNGLLKVHIPHEMKPAKTTDADIPS